MRKAEPIHTVAPSRGNPGRALAATLVVLTASNLVANLVLASDAWYVPWNLAVAAVLVLIATRVGGRSGAELGMAGDRVGSGMRWGLGIGASIAAVIILAAVVPATQGWFDDDAGRTGVGGLVVTLLVVIPFGTVVMEEIAFRACLPALLDARPGWTTRRSDLVGAALFGLWHVLPSRGLGDRNETMGSTFGDTLGQWGPVAVALLATSAAGFALMWIRRRSDSVVAPLVVHYAINAASTTAAWLVIR